MISWKWKFRSSRCVKMAVFEPLKRPVVDFTDFFKQEFPLISYTLNFTKFSQYFHILLSGLTSSNAHLNTATWLSEYNFPAVFEAQDRLEAEQEQQFQIDESLKPVP